MPAHVCRVHTKKKHVWYILVVLYKCLLISKAAKPSVIFALACRVKIISNLADQKVAVNNRASSICIFSRFFAFQSGNNGQRFNNRIEIRLEEERYPK